MASLSWQGPFPASEYCRYDHVYSDTPAGRYQIEWKSWKEYDAHCLYLDDEYLDSKDDLSDAQAAAEKHFAAKAIEFAGFTSTGREPAARQQERITQLEHALREVRDRLGFYASGGSRYSADAIDAIAIIDAALKDQGGSQ